MKLFPEQKNKRFWSAALLLVSVAGIIYFNFFVGPPQPGENAPPAAVSSPPDQPASSKPVVRKSQGGLLPYGSRIDAGLLEREDYQALKGVSPLTVSPEELGRDNLFGN